MKVLLLERRLGSGHKDIGNIASDGSLSDHVVIAFTNNIKYVSRSSQWGNRIHLTDHFCSRNCNRYIATLVKTEPGTGVRSSANLTKNENTS